MRDQTISLLESRIQSLFFVTVIAVLASVSGYNCVMHYRVGEISPIENRKLADPPADSVLRTSVSKYLSAFEQFYNDRFASRLDLQKLRSLILVECLDTSSSPLVVLGRNGWMFYFTEDLSSNDAFNREQVSNWTQLLKSRRDFLASYGIKYVLMLVPEKGTIEPELLPFTLRRSVRASRYKEMRELLSAEQIIPSVDLLPVFEGVPDRQTLYYKTDSHWTYSGARLAGRALANTLHSIFPSISSDCLDHVKLVEGEISGDLVKMLNLQGIFRERALVVDQRSLRAVVTSRTSGEDKKTPEIDSSKDVGDLPRAFILHDSFSLILQPFVSELFKEAKFYRAQSMPVEEILKYKPAVVIEEMAERNLYNLGYADDLAFGSNPNRPVTQHVQEVPKSSIGNAAQAEFSTGECAQVVSWQRHGEIVNVSIDWRVKKNCVPNQMIELQMFDKNGKVVASTIYPQNPSYLVFSENIQWSDIIAINVSTDVIVDKIGIRISKDLSRPVQEAAKLFENSRGRI